MQVCLLASGSKGNAIYIDSGETRVLVDAGLSAKELSARLGRIGVSGEDLHAIFVTHEHGDHCRGLGPMSRRYRLPVFLHPETRGRLPALGRIDDLREFEAGDVLEFRDLRVETFPITHDAASPVGYVVETGSGRIGVATDLGVATRLVRQRLSGCRVLVLESNHDEELLRDGPYPWPLKQRIRGTHGHLSNRDAADLLQGLLWEGLEGVFLAHLSEVNNQPSLAQASARAVLEGQNRCGPQLVIGRQECVTLCVECT